MGNGDYSRRTFDSANNYCAAGVWMQQGRVQLDSDWNEFMEALDRRFRAQTVDTIGEHVVPKETNDAFLIGGTAATGFTIGPGRMYVGGLLAEIHGYEQNSSVLVRFDPILAELSDRNPISYDSQPYYFPLAQASGKTHSQSIPGSGIFYLDVWQREVTCLEQPALQEKALGSGVDTTTRLQTIWQVKFQQPAAPSCDQFSPPAASAGRLSTAPVVVLTNDDLCILPPSGGYRGLENHLYRVEVHSVGRNGPMFKWSRDNASFAAAVTDITGPSQLKVSQLGRDAVMCFQEGDWVELIDDQRELMGEPGQMARIAKPPDPSSLTIDLSVVISSDSPRAFGATTGELAKRHTRMRRWDQKGLVTRADGSTYINLDTSSDGLIPVSADGTTQIVLEDGISVTFSVDNKGDGFHVGDYWVFAARTEGAWLEQLDHAPPRGIHHHYACLATLSGPNSQPGDCRKHWPPDAAGECCDCTVCITADAHNQNISNHGTGTLWWAIGQAPNGGTICLGPGTYQLDQTVNVTDNIRLRGQGAETTILQPTKPMTILSVNNSMGVIIENLKIAALDASGSSAGMGLLLSNSLDVTVQNCHIASASAGAANNSAQDIAIGLTGFVSQVVIQRNSLAGSVGVGNPSTTSPPNPGATIEVLQKQKQPQAAQPQPTTLYTADLYVQYNDLQCSQVGINLDGACAHIGETRLSANRIYQCSFAGIIATGGVFSGLPKTSAGQPIATAERSQVALDVTSRLDILANLLSVEGDGIVAGTDSTRIQGNDVTSSSRVELSITFSQSPAVGNGIVLQEGVSTGFAHCVVAGNRISQVGGAGVLVWPQSQVIKIHDNVIDATRGGIIVGDIMANSTLSMPVGRLHVRGNKLVNILPQVGNEGVLYAAAIGIVNADSVDVVANSILWDNADRQLKSMRFGIYCGSCTSTNVSGNQVTDLGAPSDEWGIEIVTYSGRADARDNALVLRRAPIGQQVSSLLFGLRIEQPSPEKMKFTTMGNAGWVVPFFSMAGGTVGKGQPPAFGIGITGNRIEVDLESSAVEIQGAVACLFANNQCLTAFVPGTNQPAVLIDASEAIIAATNYLHAGHPRATALALQLPQNGRYTVLGNITTGAVNISVGTQQIDGSKILTDPTQAILNSISH